MLQDNQKYSGWCIRLWIVIFIILFLLWSGLFIILIFIWFAFIWWKKNNNINYNRIFEYIWILDCVKKILRKFNYEDRKKYEEKFNYFNKTRVSKSKNIIKSSQNETNNKNIIKKISTISNKNKLSSNNKIINNKKNNENSYKIKSIWDDYESVIDIMNKK